MSEVVDRSVLKHSDHILNSASVKSLDVDTGLNGYDVTSLEDLVTSCALREAGIFVDIHATDVDYIHIKLKERISLLIT